MKDIADLVRIKQSTSEKLSSQQEFTILNELLIRALIPIETNTSVYREFLAEIISTITLIRRGSNDELLSACFYGLKGEPSARKIIETGIDKEYIFKFLEKISRLGKELEEAQVKQVVRRADRIDYKNLKIIYDIKSQLGESSLIAMSIRTSIYWYELALKHKESIIDHYMRLLLKTASRISHASGGRVEMENAFPEAYIAASQAVDRFRVDKGVFASFISGYLKGSTRVASTQALGLAAPGSRVASSEALQTDSLSEELDFIDENAIIVSDNDSIMIKNISAIAEDKDVKAALMLSGIVPPVLHGMSK
jgi:hypothetical protein